MHQSVIEVGTGICKNINEARREVTELRTRDHPASPRANGLRIAAAGTHPFSTGRDQEIYPDARYDADRRGLQLVARANLIFGLHVHVGIEDRETRDPDHERGALLPAAHPRAVDELAVLARPQHRA